MDLSSLVFTVVHGAPIVTLRLMPCSSVCRKLNAAGAQLVAISSQLPDKSVDQVKDSQLSFEVLSDIGNLVAKDCGLVFTLPEPLRPIYETWEIDIPDHNGDNSFELPVPATYIVDTVGKVHYAHVDMDYTRRLEPDIIIEQLQSL